MKEILWKLMRFMFIGASAFLIDTASYFLISSTPSATPVLSKILSFTIAVIYTFVMNKRYTFCGLAKRSSPNPHVLILFGKYALGQSLGATTNVLVFLIASSFQIKVLTCLTIAAVISLGINYSLAALVLDKR